MSERLWARFSPAFQAIWDECQRTGWPACYQTDLYCDQSQIMNARAAEHVDERFGWVLRECGTHIIQPPEYCDGRPRWEQQHGGSCLRYLMQEYPEGRGLYYYWDGSRLRRMKPPKLLEALRAIPHNFDWSRPVTCGWCHLGGQAARQAAPRAAAGAGLGDGAATQPSEGRRLIWEEP